MAKNIIYVFSGTGNCLNLAKLLGAEIEAIGGGDTEIILMRKEPSKLDATEADRVGFIFPCYAGGLPAGVEETVSKIRIRDNAYTFGICMYAAYMGSGLSTIHKVQRLDWWGGVSHHCSCIWLLPHNMMMPRLSVEEAQVQSAEKAKEFAKAIVNCRYKKDPPERILNKLENSAWPVLSVKKAAKFKVDADKCVRCGQCASLCPRDNIVLSDSGVEFGKDCLGCLSCLQYCPEEAIHMGGITRKRERYHNPAISAEELY